MLKNQIRKHSVFTTRLGTKVNKTLRNEDTSKRKSVSPKKTDDIFTNTFYKKLEETKDLTGKLVNQ